MLGIDPAQSVLALDFDQTLTLVRPTGTGGAREKSLRGGADARAALQVMAAAGVRMCIVTAQSPSEATVKNVARECAELGIDELFGVQPANIAALHTALQSGVLGEGHGGLAGATERLLLLLLLRTGRVAADLVRIGLTPTTTKGDGTIGYRLWSESSATWGAEQRLPRDDETPALCPVRAWGAYVEATRALRGEAASAAATATASSDRLLLSAPTSAGTPVPMRAEEAVALATAAAARAGLSARDVRWVVQSPATEMSVDGGVKLAMMGHIIAARYNKPEGLLAWLRREELAPHRLAFVDDNSDNAFSMFMHFASAERQHAAEYGEAASRTTEDPPRASDAAAPDTRPSATPPPPPPLCCAVWYPPEAAAREEAFDAPTREMLLALSRGEI